MPGRRRFLIIDDNPEGRFLLSKTLLRKYPEAVVHECQDLQAAIDVVRAFPNPRNATVVAHRAGEVDGFNLVAALRRAHSAVPIIWVSGIDRTSELEAAGANFFLHYDAWLTIGSAVEELAALPS